MSSETHSYDANPIETDPVALTGAGAIDDQAHHDSLRQFAGNVLKIIETSEPGAIKDYLSDVLSDNEGLVPADEREAVFGFLATEQRNEIRRSLVDSGRVMLDNLDRNSSKKRLQLEQTAPLANQAMRKTLETHEQEVGRHFRSQIDTRKAALGHDATTQIARRAFDVVSQHTETLEAWAKGQAHETQHFNDEFRKGLAHEHALDQASGIVKPDYDGEPKNLSRVVDEEVKETAATKLQSAVLEAQAAGKSPEEAVLELMTREPDNIAPKIIVELSAFAEQYTGLAKTRVLKVRSTAQESMQTLKGFAAQGRDGYQYVKRVEDAVDLYRRQKRTLERAASGADLAVSQSAKVLGSADQELQHVREKLARATKPKSE